MSISDDGTSYYEKLGSTLALEPENLCGRVTVISNEQELDWLDCDDTQKVVCYSDEKTDAEIRPAGYRPSLSALYDNIIIEPAPSADEVLIVERSYLVRSSERRFHLNISCGQGDSIVKDHFILGKTQYLPRWWSRNFTIMMQLSPFHEGNTLSVGTYWCQRYVEGEADPAVSGRLHVTTSEDMYVLTAPEDSVVRALQLLLFEDVDYEDGSGVEDADRPGPTATNEMSDLVVELQDFLRSDERMNPPGQIRFLALRDFPNDGREAFQESTSVTETTRRRTRRTVSLIIQSTTALDSALLRRVNIASTGNGLQSEPFLRGAFRCPDENVEGRTWRQSSNGLGYTVSEPACAVPGIPALVERRCRPSFDRAGARWGPFCAAGECQEELHRCQPPPSICPPGFTSTTVGGSEVPSELCMLPLPGVTFEERGLACRRRDPTARPWFPRQRLLEVSLFSPPLVNQTLWLPFQRLWSHGPLLPDILSLLNPDDREVASLNGDLNCTVVTPRGWLASASCAERHAVLCATRPLYSHDDQALQRSSSRGRPCQPFLGSGSMPGNAPEHCFAFLCPNTSSHISWSEASSLCTESNSSLASLTSQRQLDALIRLGRARGRSARTAVNLERRDGRVSWGDGTPLSYPALSPDLSTVEQHTRGILDISRGQYDFVGRDEGTVSCALCQKHVEGGALEITLFYGDVRPGASIFANVTNVQHLVARWESALSCFVSTAERIDASLQTEGRYGFSVREQNVLPMNDGLIFIEIFPSVDFGYLTCGLMISESGEQITSNSLVLIARFEEPSVQEYVIGLRGGQWRNSLCDLTFCGTACTCFNQSLVNQYSYISETQDGISYSRAIHPIRATPSANNRVITNYYFDLNFSPPLRRRRQTNYRDAEGPRQITNQQGGFRQRSPGQNPASPDGTQVLRDEFGAQLAYVNHARCCPAEQTEEPVTLNWPKTCSGISTSVELCVDSSGRPAVRRCLGSPLTGVRWGSVEFHGTSCAPVSAVTTELYRLSQIRVMEANSVTTAAELARLTAKPTVLVSQDLVSAAVTMENIQAALEGPDPPLPEDMPIVQQHTVVSVSNIMDADWEAIATGSDSLAAGPRVVRALERILIDSFVESAPHVTAGNVAVRSGDFAGILSSSKEIIGSSLRTVAKNSGRSDAFGVEMGLILEGKKPNIGAVFLVYRDGRLLHSRGQRVTSQVVSVLLPNEGDETRFKSKVLVTFRSRPGQCVPAPVCAFWDVVASKWSTRGCWLEKIHNGSDVCRCNHLTNFARIFNYEKDVYLSETYQRTLDVITYVGSALSLLGLLLTMATFVLFKKWRRLKGSQIVMHLSVALTGVYLAFLVSLAATENHIFCVCLSVLLHYFLLATFGWMAVEAVNSYLRFVRVLGTHISRFMLKASLLVWGGSLVPVILVLVIRPHCYDGQPDVCWMDFQSFYYAVALPVVILMVFNAVMFSLIVFSLNCGRQKGLRTNQPERQLALRRLRVSLVTFVLLGLPWVFGFLSIREARLVFAALFCVCSMMQGETWDLSCSSFMRFGLIG